MNLTKIAIEKRAITYFAVFLIMIAGIGSFFSLGQLEDPEFTIKTAVITTYYPGASPEEVELEVTDRIELAIQELPQLDYVESYSRAGFSLIKVEIKSEYWTDRLPQVWDELRRKIRNIENSLPSGASRPNISDDFGDVFGFQLAVIGDGYNYSELEKYAKDIKKELSLVKGVARVDLWGVQEKVIYVDASQTQLSQLGLTDDNIAQTLRQQNMVVDAGGVDLKEMRLRIEPTGEFKSPEDIGNLNITASLSELANLTVTAAPSSAGQQSSGELIKIRDISMVNRGYREPPIRLMHYNGETSIGLSITNISGVNIRKVGKAIDKRLGELITNLPIGIEVNRVHWQSNDVAKAVNGFLISFGEAVGIVLVILTIFMGWRMGIVIGASLVLTILASFVLMAIFKIDLQRMSLGALVIALGMMVDNSIVVADGVTVRLQRGMDRKQAAIEAASQPCMPLLGATVVAVMAFYPIFASKEGAGEYCRTLFIIVAISLLVSWIVSITVTPIQCLDILHVTQRDNTATYSGGLYKFFQKVLHFVIRHRVVTLVCMITLLVIAMVGFGNVKHLFFPASSMKKFMIDFWTPEGTSIQQVEKDLKMSEKKLLADGRVESVATFIGQGPPRFYLPVEPEDPNQSYAQLIVNVHDYSSLQGLIQEMDSWFAENYPQAIAPIRKYGVGPSNTWKFELRISGPAVADPSMLRSLANKVTKILDDNPNAGFVRTNWRQRVKKVVLEYNQERARWVAVMRDDIAKTTKRAFDGLQIGLYREKDNLIPIVLRHIDKERNEVGNIDTLQVQPTASIHTLPLSQVIDGVNTEWEDPIIWRRDRRRTITIQSNPIFGVTLPTLRASVIKDIAAIDLPPGYTMKWGGEHEDTVDSQASLIPGVIPTIAVMLFIIVALFNAFKPPLIIIFTIPFSIIGIVTGLLTTDTPFGFLALLGAMSLVGMMIKNAIVLLDQINIEIGAGKTRYQAIIDSALSRLRPVVLAAATTVLGVIPLLQDVFWVGMAVTIMVGLTFGTMITMVIIPVIYAVLYKVPSPKQIMTSPLSIHKKKLSPK